MPMEKQGTVENQLAHTIDQTEYDSRYDRTAKKLLANKQILAQIMKGCVNEYSDCTVDDQTRTVDWRSAGRNRKLRFDECRNDLFRQARDGES